MTKGNPTSSEQQISKAITELCSDDVLTQNSAVEQLIQLGEVAVPALLKILQQAETHHVPAMYALAKIGNSQATEAFKEGLTHQKEKVRAYAALGLTHINHHDALNACLHTINDGVDELHLDITPAVSALSDMGIAAVPSLLNLLNDDNEMTRLHGQRALELFINKRHGFISGQGFPSQDAEAAARSEWLTNGNYDYATDKDRRTAAIAKWQQWLDANLDGIKE